MKNTNTIWVLVAGLAVGFLIGREYGASKGPGGEEKSSGAAARSAKGKETGPTEIPSNWLKESDIGAVESMKDLTPAQRYLVLKLLNEKPCDCGCPHGKESFAKCKKDDPDCPRAPGVIAKAIELAKEGKGFDEMVAAIAKPAAPAAQRDENAPQKAKVAAWNPIKGPKFAKVTIVEYSDFQWPFCSRVGPTLKQIADTYGKDVRIVFRHQPLSFHDHAMEAAEASMAAHAQGKFWEYHDKLFANQQALDRASLDKYAQELGLNMARFKADMDGHKHKKNIDEDSKEGSSIGANGTPSFFVNGTPVSGAQPFDAFKTVIDKELKRADELIKAGTSLDKLYDKVLDTISTAPQAAPAAPPPEEKANIDVGNAPSKGPKNAVVTLMEFSDFQWPFCSRVGPTLKQLEEDYKGKLRIVFKQKPLPFHDKAHLAAQASLAAHEQGKFWQYHDQLFAHQDQLDRAGLEKAAEAVGLNMQKFKTALDSGKFKEQVDKEVAEGDKNGAGGTPTFFINGTKLVGAQPVAQFKALIDAELAKKK